VATTILIKMHRARYLWITCTPLAWLVVVTFTAGWQKIFSDQPRLGFLAEATRLQGLLDSGAVAAGKVAETHAQIFNARLDAFVCAALLVMVATILIDSLRIWIGILRGVRSARVEESAFVVTQLSMEGL